MTGSAPPIGPQLCKTCAATGRVSGSRCPTCKGVGSALLFGGNALTWGLALDASASTERRLEAAARGGLNFTLLLLGLLGAVSLGTELFAVGPEYVLQSNFWTSGSPRILFFWITAWFDMYLVARMIREGDRTDIVRRPAYRDATPEIRPLAFEEYEAFPGDRRVDIARAFSAPAIRAVEAACALAERESHAAAGAVHLMAALLSVPEVGLALHRLGADAGKLRESLISALGREAPRTGALGISPALYHLLFAAYLDAARAREKHVGPLALLAPAVAISEPVQEVFEHAGLEPRAVANVAAWIRGDEELRARYRAGRRRASLRSGGAAGRAMTGLTTPYLDQFAEDLTEAARRGAMAPIVGREAEIAAIFRIIASGGRGVLIVGPAGVGKDTLLRAVAERMVEEDVPAPLSDKRLLMLSVPRLVAGASAAEAAARLERIFSEAQRAGNVVLAAPNISGSIGVSVGTQGSMDLAGVVASHLTNGRVLLLGTATPEEERSISRSSLANAFESVTVAEPDGDDAIRMCEAHTSMIGYEHRVSFLYAAVERAVSLADRYLPGRALPASAIEVLREAAASVRASRGERATVGAEDVATVISEKSHVPVQTVTEDESAKLLGLEAVMHERVVGQDEAVAAVAAAIRRSRAELRSGTRPIASFLFLGPTGVGKTEVARTLAATYFGGEEHTIRLDMSEYQTTESLYRLVGAPGSATGGILTEAIRNRPFSLILLDELEKAHPDILNVFLQVMEDGRLTDATGRVADVTNAIIIATSNAGTPVIQEEIKKGTTVEAIKKRLIESDLKGTFRPEFLNRFDGIIVFRPLTEPEILEVARRMLQAIARKLDEKGIRFQISEEAVAELAAAGFDPAFGARPLRRVIQERVEDVLATFLLQHKLTRHDVVRLESGGKISVSERE